jgi:biofilm PGA synthesis N-glycosyltransferase PgaC
VRTAAEILLAFIFLYPIVTASVWVAGGLIFRFFDERSDGEEPPGGWPGATLLIPAFNEEAVIATCVRAALEVDYPVLEVLVLDDGSTDRTASVATEAGGGDARLEVVRDPVNLGKAERLNTGLRRARYDLVATSDADTHLHPLALKLLASRMVEAGRIGAVAGGPHVTNRGRLLTAMQVLEAAAIIGLIRRTQSLSGGVGTVAGVLGLFRREAVLEVGGYDPRMATEDIDLTWRLLLAGWHTVYEPRALVGMEVPSTLSALWAQRKRWALGQGEVLRTHFREVMRWRNRRVWLLAIESSASLLWVVGLVLSLIVAAVALLTGHGVGIFGFSLAWGIAIAVVATLQLAFALQIDIHYDRRAALAFLIGPLYPIAYWMISATAALRCETVGLLHGPRGERVTWDIPRARPDVESNV